MAVYIPIISEFNSKGIDKAVREFQSLQGVGAKAGFAIKKAAVPAGIAIAGLAAALGDAAKGAIEDQAAQDKLAESLQKTTGATDAQINGVEDWITAQGKLLGFSDDKLRPVMDRLSRATGDVATAQDLARQAMDISVATGKPLETVVGALEKAYGGNLTALQKLAPEYRQMIEDGASFEDVMYALSQTTGGAATAAADTAAGKFARLKIGLDETKESIGAALLPAIEKVLPFLQTMGTWASDHTSLFLAIAGAIAAIAGAVVIAGAAMKVYEAYTIIATGAQAAFNAVMALNPITLIVIAIGLLIAGLVIAYKKFEGFRNIVDSIFGVIKTVVTSSIGVIKSYFETLLGFYKGIFNGIASLWNNTVGKLSFKVPSWVPGLGGKGFDVPNIPMLAEGGIVTSATLAMIGEKGPEAVIPLDRMGQMGGNNVTINVNGGDPQSVVDALRKFYRQNGNLPIGVSY
jgi:hypothetical protein